MAKNKKNPKKEEKELNKAMLKNFTEASVFVVSDNLRESDIGDVFMEIFLKLDGDVIKHLNNEYEKRLLLSISNPEAFAKELHPFYVRMASYIRENKLYHDYYELCYQVFIQLEKRGAKSNVIDAYMDLLIQQPYYFMETPRKCVYGVTSDDKLLLMDEPGQNLSIINHEIYKGMKKSILSENEMVQIFRKNGYPNMKSMDEAHKIISSDQILSNMLYSMAPVINEDVQDIIRKPFRDPSTLLVYDRKMLLNLISPEILKKKLLEREVLLPSEGVTAIFSNTGDIKEIYMKEIFRGDSIILLWRIKDTDNNYTSGFYDTANAIFYSYWRDSTARIQGHYPLESIILQQYLRLTTPLLKEQEQTYSQFRELNSMGEMVLDSEPAVWYGVHEKTEGKREGTRRYFDRKKYITDLVNISPFLRNLPAGAVASDEAIEKARRMGITLPPGKTLVRGFQRKTWHNPENNKE